MSNGAPVSDAFVFFGATGDLAYKKVFPSLQSMVQHGRLNVPVIGVAKAGWGLPQFIERIRKSLEDHASGGVDQASFSAGSLAVQSTDMSDVRTTKVAELRAAIAGGTYNVSPSAVADKMVESMMG